ncbi:MAG: NUDIX domain-containing protein [Candidatus Nanohaloarchaea archaeon]
MAVGTVDAIVFYKAREEDKEFFQELKQQDKERLAELGVDLTDYGEPGIYTVLIERGKTPYKEMLATAGGHIENGETPTEAAIRELKEETGIQTEHLETVTEAKENLELVFDPRYDPEDKLPEDEPEEIYLIDGLEDRDGEDFHYYTAVFDYQPENPDRRNFQLKGETDAEKSFWVPLQELPKMAFTQHRIVEWGRKQYER